MGWLPFLFLFHRLLYFCTIQKKLDKCYMYMHFHIHVQVHITCKITCTCVNDIRRCYRFTETPCAQATLLVHRDERCITLYILPFHFLYKVNKTFVGFTARRLTLASVTALRNSTFSWTQVPGQLIYCRYKTPTQPRSAGKEQLVSINVQ